MPTEVLCGAGVLALMWMVSGCAADGSLASQLNAAPMGEASRQTFAAQIIDPDPKYADPVPQTSGDQAQAAIDRYSHDQVKKPEKLRTSKVGSDSGGN